MPPLAILYSSELGLAQSAYLKAKAKLHVAEQAFNRAQFLLQEQVIGEAELQRRQAELLSTQAEANESHDRLKLLGMNDEEFRRLESSRKIVRSCQSWLPLPAASLAQADPRGGRRDHRESICDCGSSRKSGCKRIFPRRTFPSSLPSMHRGVGRWRCGSTPIRKKCSKARSPTSVMCWILSHAPCSSGLNCRIAMGGSSRKCSPPFGSFPNRSPIDWRCRRPRCNAIKDAPSVRATQLRTSTSYGRSTSAIPTGRSFPYSAALNEGEPVVTHGAFVLKSEFLKKPV